MRSAISVRYGFTMSVPPLRRVVQDVLPLTMQMLSRMQKSMFSTHRYDRYHYYSRWNEQFENFLIHFFFTFNANLIRPRVKLTQYAERATESANMIELGIPVHFLYITEVNILNFYVQYRLI